MKVYVHIGYPKTGSTAIQSHVATNRQWLNQQGVYVPEAGYGSGAGHQHLIPSPAAIAALKPRAKSQEPVKPKHTTLQQLQEELAEAEHSGYQTALITWEGFASSNFDQVSALADALSNQAVTLLAYVRENGERYESGLLQKLERHNFAGTDRLFKRADFDRMVENAKGYHELLSQWVKAFQNEITIRTRIYDRSRFMEGNIVLDFLGWLDLKPDSAVALQSTSINPSLDARSGAALLLAKQAGLQGASLVSFSRALLKNIEASGAGSRHFLDAAERDSFWMRFEDDNRQLFHDFRPENAYTQENGFPKPVIPERPSALLDELAYFRSVSFALKAVAPLVWQGNTLISKNLNWLLVPPSTGWKEQGSPALLESVARERQGAVHRGGFGPPGQVAT